MEPSGNGTGDVETHEAFDNDDEAESQTTRSRTLGPLKLVTLSQTYKPWSVTGLTSWKRFVACTNKWQDALLR